MSDSSDELALLEAKIRHHDAAGGPDAAWRAADAVFDKARLIERRDGDDAALPLYREVVRRLEDREDPGPRGLALLALDTIAVLHGRQGREAECREALESLVGSHLDDAPLGAAEVVVDATLELSVRLKKDGEYKQAIELLERLIARFGAPEAPDAPLTRARATAEIVQTLLRANRFDETLARADRLIEMVEDSEAPDLRGLIAEAMAAKASALSELAVRRNDSITMAKSNWLCEDIIKRFDGDEDPELIRYVEWARAELAPKRRLRLWRH